MRKLKLTAITVLFTLSAINFVAQEAAKQEFEVKVITSVESIIPGGLGRSRLISTNDERDHKQFTSSQTKDDNTRNKSNRKDIRVKNFEETKLLNFYNLVGIRFQNIAANDALISSKLSASVELSGNVSVISA